MKRKLRDLRAAMKAVNLLTRLHKKYPEDVPEISDQAAVALQLAIQDAARGG